MADSDKNWKCPGPGFQKKIFNFSHLPASSKPSSKSSSQNMAMDMQRAIEMQRQYLEMLTQSQQMPNQRGGHSNWKNN